MKWTPEYTAWQQMKDRCFNPNCNVYEHYGQRGITVCDKWVNSFQSFFSDLGNKPTLSHSLDRIDVNGNYEPSNCRWATRQEQTRNKRNNRFYTANGKTLIISDWATELRVSVVSIYRHLKSGKSFDWIVSRFSDPEYKPNRLKRLLTHDGKTANVMQWAKELNVFPHCIRYHLNKGRDLGWIIKHLEEQRSIG